MKNLPQIFIIAGLIIIFSLLFFYFYFLKADVIKLKNTLKKEVKKGDIMVFFPDWEKNDILSLDGLPIVVSQERHYLNLYGFNRAYIIKNIKTFQNKDLPLLNEMLLNKRFTIGRYEIEEYSLPLWNLSSYMNNLTVYITDDTVKRACQKEGEKYKCGDMGWQYVGLATVDINGQQAECIWAHPIGGKRITIETTLPRSIAGDFVVYRALASTSGFDFDKPEVITDIFINDDKVFSSAVHRQREWQKDKFVFKNQGNKILKVDIFSPREFKNHFCFNVEAF